VEEINNAGVGEVVSGIGIQSIADPRTNLGSNLHSAARINQVMQNLAITGLPITLTEFSVPSPAGFTVTPQRAAQIYDESLRMMFGSPEATSFLIWEAWPSPSATPDGVTTIVDSNWNLTQAGQALVSLLDSWKTPTQNLIVGPDGTIDFTGFYGDYEITVDGRVFDFSLMKGTEDYSVLVAVPGDFDGDFDVDGADLTVWQGAFGVNDIADADGDSDSDGEDFLVWQRHLGEDHSLAAVRAAPEPAAGLLLVVGLNLAPRGVRSFSYPTRRGRAA
jgi:hypothetical protein